MDDLFTVGASVVGGTMASIRLATFNVENLFARWRFRDAVNPAEAVKDGWTVDKTLFQRLRDTDKKLTGRTVKELRADVLALQEVENVDTLKRFRTEFLGGASAYPYVAGIDGNDPRLIDVAVLSRLPITHVRSYQHRPKPENPSEPVFSRDCLEVGVSLYENQPAAVTLFVNHLKSMLGGRGATRTRRAQQAAAIKEIISEQFGHTPGAGSWVICGDFNDYREPDDEGESGILELLDWDQVIDVVARRELNERWTHFYSHGNAYQQLDYLLLSRSLAQTSPSRPEIIRKGMPLRAQRYTGPRFDGVGQNHPKASDHCPVVMDLTVPDPTDRAGGDDR